MPVTGTATETALAVRRTAAAREQRHSTTQRRPETVGTGEARVAKTTGKATVEIREAATAGTRAVAAAATEEMPAVATTAKATAEITATRMAEEVATATAAMGTAI